MLRVGLTGDLGTGKSTVAKMLAERGAMVFSSDEMGRAMMQPGERVFDEIVARFGPGVVSADGTLDRKELARLAFDERAPRVEELNAIVHPAVIAAQARALAAVAKKQPHAIVLVESALLFTTIHANDQPWQTRFDCVVLVVASDETKLNRFVKRAAAGRPLSEDECEALRGDAKKRIALQKPTAEHEAECIVLRNDGSLAELTTQINALWTKLQKLEAASYVLD